MEKLFSIRYTVYFKGGQETHIKPVRAIYPVLAMIDLENELKANTAHFLRLVVHSCEEIINPFQDIF